MTVAKFQGGGAFNVIPDSVTIGGTFRAFSKESIIMLRQRIEEVYLLLCKNSAITYNYEVGKGLIDFDLMIRLLKGKLAFRGAVQPLIS